MSAYPLERSIGLNAGELIEAGFEKIVPPVGDLQRFVLGVIRRQNAIDHGLGATQGEITMQLHHGHLRRDQIRAVYLDFITALRMNADGAADN